MRRMSLALASVAVVSGLTAASADATFAGRNGPIAYRTWTFENGVGPLMRARPDGTHVRRLSGRPGLFSDWRADGRRIAFDFFDRDGDVHIATAWRDGSDVRVLTSGRGIHEVPSWSPSGRRLVFDFSPERDTNSPTFETRLWTMRADGGQARALPMRNPGFDVEPRWSPNGRWITFIRLRIRPNSFSAAVLVVPSKGGRARQLTRWGQEAEHPTWSPDSRWIVFNLGPVGTIKAVRRDGSQRRTILPARRGRGGHKPWFSPDGSRILFMCENQGLLPDPPADYNEDLCVMRRDGSHVVNITRTPRVHENWPSWGPAPERAGHGERTRRR
jgi:Tol biopolymer transport system component